MRKTLSKYKFKKLAWESLYNGIRLHEDSLFLLRNGSFPSALQLSILAIEEIAKAKWIDHVFEACRSNEYFPDPLDEEQVKEEQTWLKMLYFHNRKQNAFIGHEMFQYSPKFVRFVQNGGLEKLKQNATYVGLSKKAKDIDVNSRINVPVNINLKEVIKTVSLLNSELLDMCRLNHFNDGYFGIDELNSLIDQELSVRLNKHNLTSNLKSNNYNKAWDDLIERRRKLK